MRIVGGTRRGARISAPKGAGTRPTGDRVREALFDILGPLDGASCADLYAGSGALGLEAMSRGASRCVFVESDRVACRAIRSNLETLRLTGAIVACRDVLGWLTEESGRARRYDLVLCDPPYGAWESLERPLGELLPGILAPAGVLVVETAAADEPTLPLDLVTSRRYGSARITMLRPT